MWVWSIIVGVVSQRWVWLVKDTTNRNSHKNALNATKVASYGLFMEFSVSHEWTWTFPGKFMGWKSSSPHEKGLITLNKSLYT